MYTRINTLKAIHPLRQKQLLCSTCHGRTVFNFFHAEVGFADISIYTYFLTTKDHVWGKKLLPEPWTPSLLGGGRKGCRSHKKPNAPEGTVPVLVSSLCEPVMTLQFNVSPLSGGLRNILETEQRSLWEEMTIRPGW